ncbi:MAG: Cobyrinic acid a,c-diamide synthetase [uncultured Propionibacteriaceae bacterium]|uniref:Hydrogenobyrinate a,c-diamide synthase n=1 Tax=uncultured Propionibacteriaceae bacterium TaxID=257457 RepID=A0A6J4PQP7_9ACTN|nr:MAG: Cobyrinic acid a,c-diamide synthetase [uncultured Propionibacteriaceae bacterium]
MVTVLPRVVIAAPASGQGKTTISSGLMGALRLAGLSVAGFKIGPDYIDPGYHAMATGRAGRNLDPHLCHPEQMVPLLLHGAQTPEPADIAVIEGVMGLFDGQIGGNGFASTAHVATLVSAPVILVLDISAASRTVAAIVHGLTTFDPEVRISGVILNKAGSQRHAREVGEALEATGIPVLGIVPRDAGVVAPARHLGLVPVAERDDAAASLQRLAEQVSEHVSLTGVLEIAHSAAPLDARPWQPARVVVARGTRHPVVAVAGGRAFTFRYPETEELLRAAGCGPVVFDPVHDQQLPAGTAGIYLGGGFPEVHAGELAQNAALRADIAAAVAAGVPTVAECAGLIYLCQAVADRPMLGSIQAHARMSERLTLGYRTAVADHDHLLAIAGTRVTGHEFHRTTVEPDSGDQPAWLVAGAKAGFSADPAGIGSPTLHASYLHIHWAGHPSLAQRFSDAVHACAEDNRTWVAAAPTSRLEPQPDHDLDHHGDSDIADDLVDLAVNVRVSSPPSFLQKVIVDTTVDLGAYPRTAAAVTAIAAAHAVDETQVLPTAGAAEAFTLLARALSPDHPLVIHPQFTEPEAALLTAGHRPFRLLLDAADGFVLDAARVNQRADLIMIGNPTNPTSVLHPAATIRALVRPGRIVCVDEAFMDAVPGETESLLHFGLDGVLVIRSLTKTWGLAGLRAGYVVGDAEIVAALRRQQQPWSVSTPALAATIACLTPQARAIAAEAADEFGRLRTVLVEALHSVGLPVADAPTAPFVLVDTSTWPGPSGWVRAALRDRGFAVRRGETFPGLGPDWIRMAVRDELTTQALTKALLEIRESSDDTLGDG